MIKAFQITTVAIAILLIARCEANGQLDQSQPLKFSLKGKISGVDSGSLMISYGSNQKPIEVVNGQFSMTDSIERPILASIWMKPKSNAATFYLDAGDIHVKLNVEKFEKPNEKTYQLSLDEITGSPTEETRLDYQRFYQEHKKEHDFPKRLFEYLNSQISPEETNPFWGTVVAEMAAIEKVLTYKQLLVLSRKLKTNAMSDVDRKMLEAGMKAAAKYGIGDRFPDFKLPDLAGENIGPAHFRGKFLLVNFWASWCGPCRDKQRAISAIDAEKRNYEVLCVSIDEDLAAWKAATKADGVTWASVLDQKSTVANDLAIHGLPANFLLDREGNVIAFNVSLEEIARLTRK